MGRTAIITGVTGQDGSYLAEFLLTQGYRVVGMVRRASTENFERIAHLRDRIELRQADLLDQLSLITLLKDVQPHEIYNLAAQSFVPTSWQQPVLTADFDAVGVTRVLEAMRLAAPGGWVCGCGLVTALYVSAKRPRPSTLRRGNGKPPWGHGPCDVGSSRARPMWEARGCSLPAHPRRAEVGRRTA